MPPCPASGKMLSSAFGSAWKSATELMVGTMMSLSPLATRTGWLIALSFFAPLSEGGALRLHRLVAGSRIAIVLARLQAPKKCVGGRLARLGLREEQEVLGMFLLGGRILEGALQ